MGQRDADIPVAKLAEDNWATALAWRQHQHQQTATNCTSPMVYGDDDPGHEASSTDRWRSARATARQARRSNSSGTAVAAGAVAAYRGNPPSVSSRSPDGRGGRVGDGSGGVGRGGGGWEQPAVVVVGDSSGRLSDEEEEPVTTTTTTVLPGRQSGGFSL